LLNPFAALGDAASTALDPAQIDAAKEAAGVHF
jgi:hypothetical protein